FAMIIYARVLVIVSSAGARSFTDELQNDTLNVLRTTPYSLREIIASKAAAAMWRQVEDLGLLMVGVALLSTPLLISYYGTLWPLDQNPLLSRVAIILGLGISIIRMLLEPFMVAMIGILMGTALRTRSAAILGTLFVSGFYFLLINLPRLIHMSWPVRFIVDFVLPLALPVLIIGLVIWLTSHLIERD
ncbi:MAG: ABC transporter permease, partial [Anaerolineae bacterium]|nr:ABC transporter permease [Anaerolineae bacterium]